MLLAHESWGSASGAPAILLHGALDSRATWSTVGQWLSERGWHAIAIDLPAHGESQLGEGAKYDPKSVADYLLETFRAIRPDAERIGMLVGHSLGALAALGFAAEYPQLVERLVLEDPPFADSLAAAEARSAKPRLSGWIDSARTDPVAFADVWATHSDPRCSRAEVERQVQVIAAADRIYAPALFEALKSGEIVDLAARCSMPTLVLVGREEAGDADCDHSVSVLRGEERRRVRAALPNGVMVELDGGHDLHGPHFDQFVGRLGEWIGDAAPAEPAD